MGSAGGGLVEGDALPSAFALFLVQVLFIICLSRVLTSVLRPVSSRAHERLRRPVRRARGSLALRHPPSALLCSSNNPRSSARCLPASFSARECRGSPMTLARTANARDLAGFGRAGAVRTRALQRADPPPHAAPRDARSQCSHRTARCWVREAAVPAACKSCSHPPPPSPGSHSRPPQHVPRPHPGLHRHDVPCREREDHPSHQQLWAVLLHVPCRARGARADTRMH